MYLICFCSEWCQTCRNFKLLFDSAKWPGVKKIWVDVDSDIDFLDGISMPDVPTVLIASNDLKTSFYSKLPGSIDRLKFLVDHMKKGTFPVGHVDENSLNIILKIKNGKFKFNPI